MKLLKKHQVKTALENKLKIKFRSGKELNGWLYYKDKKILRITVPKGRETLKMGTQNSIRNNLKLSTQDFDNLILCPLSEQDYIERLKQKNMIY